jgi:hypothetical protein
MADDEGTDNTVDIDRFGVWFNAWNRLDADDPGTQINTPDSGNGTTVYWFATPGEEPFDPPRAWEVNQSVQVAFDSESYDFNFAKLQLTAYTRDYDTTSSDEEATASIELVGSDMWSWAAGQASPHTFLLTSADFRFRVEISVQPIVP